MSAKRNRRVAPALSAGSCASQVSADPQTLRRLIISWPRPSSLRAIVWMTVILATTTVHSSPAPWRPVERTEQRPKIYQLSLRQFGNTNETRKPNGTIAENGVGKFNDLDRRALRSLRRFGVTHLWLLGALRQATGTDYAAAGLPADDPDLLKGRAGSPFAVRDYFDVCPDYAADPARRIEEFRSLVERAHREGLRIVLDFVPNHVARSYRSVVKPELSFGLRDDRTRFFAPNNNFYYLEGQPPLRLPTVKDGVAVSPTCQVTGGCDGLFADERDHGKVTGNNLVTYTPGMGDWYETVKLNYGFDFRQGRHAPKAYPTADNPGQSIPDTWWKMDAVLAYWQDLGVDGFRCDMAHWIPLEFWRWAISRARERQSGTFFVAEAYDNDPNKLTDGNVLVALVEAGFDSVYDDQSYDVLKDVYDGPKWANDLDGVVGAVAPLHESLRYAENHDEVRLANPKEWGRLGPAVGRPVMALLSGIGRGPLLIYNGQEVGEPALGAEGFGGDDSRTSIFDYWSMPELTKWVNGGRYDGGRLSPAQKDLRAWYARLLRVVDQPAFRSGEFIPLNRANVGNPFFGRPAGETASGHWVYAYVRHEPKTAQAFVVAVNLHPSQTFTDVRILLTPPALSALGAGPADASVELQERLAARQTVRLKIRSAELRERGLRVPALQPLTPYYFERVR